MKDIIKISKKYINDSIELLGVSDYNTLKEIIIIHNDLYYNKESPIISDYEYDILLKKFKKLEKKYSKNLKDSNKVWIEIKESTFKKVKHSIPMISLDNTYNEGDLDDFDSRVKKIITQSQIYKEKPINDIDYTIEFKFDWLWVELIYNNWELIQAITRWNWIEWEDISENVKQVKNIPKEIKYKERIEVRGEVIMPISVFKKLNEKSKKVGDKIFSNPRNAASWSLRLLDNSITKERKLKFFWYDVLNYYSFENNNSYYNLIKKLDNLWFETSWYFKKIKWIKNVINSIDNFWETKKSIDFEIDGLVIKVNDINLWDLIWRTEHHPRYAIAYKFPAEILTTRILSIEHSIWRTWTMTPVANLEPINIWWVIVKRATLHNYDEIKKLDVKIWDHVFIKRAWEVIPKIISVITWERIWEEIDIIIPNKCPSCDSKILKDNEKVRYYCPNWSMCPKQKSEKLAWSVWKQWFNIDWLWEKQIELFLYKSIINNITDIFKIHEKQDQILEFEGFKEKSINNLVKSIEKSKDIDIFRFITALWIPWVWKKTAKTLSRLFKSKNNLIKFSQDFEELEKLEDIWPEIARNVIDYFSDDNNSKIIKELVEILNIKYYTSPIFLENSSDFFWKKVCITWSFEWYKREELALKLEENWWEFMNSVTKKTDYLLAWKKAWSKLKKAGDLWINVLSIEDFLQKLW